MKFVKLLLLPFMAAVVAAAFLWPEPAKGFLGESSRIVFFHVPCAWTAALAFIVAAAYSVAWLIKREPRFDAVAETAVRLGLLFAVLTLVSGSLFAKIMWGSYWNWDPKEVWTFVIWVVYAGHLHARGRGRVHSRRLREVHRSALGVGALSDEWAKERLPAHAAAVRR